MMRRGGAALRLLSSSGKKNIGSGAAPAAPPPASAAPKAPPSGMIEYKEQSISHFQERYNRENEEDIENLRKAKSFALKNSGKIGRANTIVFFVLLVFLCVPSGKPG